MKKLLILSAIFLFPLLTQGAVLTASAPEEVTVGDLFSVQIEVESDENIYTVLTDLSFPTELLEFVRIEPASTWIPFTEEGYDFVDENKGVIRKTFGYPGGVAISTVIMDVIFKSTAQGQNSIVLGGESRILDVDSKDVLKGTNEITFVSVSPYDALSFDVVSNTPALIEEQIAPLFNGLEDGVATSSVRTEVLNTVSNLSNVGRTQAAAAIGSIVIPPEMYLVLLLLLLVAIAVIGLFIMLRKKRQE